MIFDPSRAFTTDVTVPATFVSVLVMILMEPLVAYSLFVLVKVEVTLLSVLTTICIVPRMVGVTYWNQV